MASKVKQTGRIGNMLLAMANRGGSMLADYRGFPPSKVFVPLQRRGLVEIKRVGSPKTRRNIWHLTAKGWSAIGRDPIIRDPPRLCYAQRGCQPPDDLSGLAVLDAGGDFADGVVAFDGQWLGGETFVSFDKKAVNADQPIFRSAPELRQKFTSMLSRKRLAHSLALNAGVNSGDLA